MVSLLHLLEMSPWREGQTPRSGSAVPAPGKAPAGRETWPLNRQRPGQRLRGRHHICIGCLSVGAGGGWAEEDSKQN